MIHSEHHSVELFDEIDDPLARARETMITVTLSSLVAPSTRRPFRTVEVMNAQTTYIDELADTGFTNTFNAIVETLGTNPGERNKEEIKQNLTTITRLFVEGETATRWDRYNGWLQEPVSYWRLNEEQQWVFTSAGYYPELIVDRLNYLVDTLPESGELSPQMLATYAFKEIQRSTKLQIPAEAQLLSEPLGS